MIALEKEYRCYAMDFWGFGESEKKREQFQITDFVELVNQFMERLGIPSAPIVGHSMGGTVTLGVALQHPERVKKIAVVGSPVNGKSFMPMLRPFVIPLFARVMWNSPWLFRLGMRLIYAPMITRKQPREFYEMTAPTTTVTTLESFFNSIASLYGTNFTDQLSQIKVPALGVYGAKDVLINPKQRNVFKSGISNSQILYLPGSGHIPMMDEPEMFNDGLRSFLKS